MSTTSLPKRLVIAGGTSAAARGRRLYEQCEITVFEREPHASFTNCALPYCVGGEILTPDDLLVQTQESLRARFNLDVRVNTEVTVIDRTARLVKVHNRISGREYDQPYDALILSPELRLGQGPPRVLPPASSLACSAHQQTPSHDER